MTSNTKNSFKQWRYYSANLLRTMTTAKRAAALSILLVMNVGILMLLQVNGGTSTSLWTLYQTLSGMMVMYISIMECILVYSDDFKAKTMQAAIGRGIKRRHVVLCKFMELATVLLIDYALIAVSFVITNAFMPVRLDQSQINVMLISYSCQYLSNLAAISVAMIPAFWLQSGGASILLYLAINFRFLVSLVNLLDVALGTHFQLYVINNLAERFRSYLLVEVFEVKLLIGILLWMLFSYIATALLFSRKELDF